MGLWCPDTQPRETQALGEMDGTVHHTGALSSAAWLAKEGHLVCNVFKCFSYYATYCVLLPLSNKGRYIFLPNILEINSYVFYQRLVEESPNLSPDPVPLPSDPVGEPSGVVEDDKERRGEKVDGVAKERRKIGKEKCKI